MDRGPAQCFCTRVLNVGVARSANTHSHVFFPVFVQDVRQSRLQKNGSSSLGHSGKLRLHGFQRVIRIVITHNDRVAGQSVPAGVVARDEAGDVDPGNRGKNRVISRKGDATGGEGGEIWREVGPDL